MKLFGLNLFEKKGVPDIIDKSSASAVNNLLNTAGDFPDLEVTNYIDYNSFNKFRQLSSNRTAQYRAYDSMTEDTIISSALEMYADDASQYDSEGRLIWVETEDAKLADMLNSLLEILSVPDNLWGIYYGLAMYGDVYLRLYKKTQSTTTTETGIDGINGSANNQYEDYLEVCDNPEDIFDLLKNGKTVQYAYINRDYGRHKKDRLELYPSDQFVHIYIKRPATRDKQLFEFDTKDEDGQLVRNSYKVRRGKSMLHDVYPVEQEIRLLENSILLNRISRSAITRMISVEVGDMPKTEVRELLRRVKSSLEGKLAASVNKGIKGYNSPGQIDNVVVTPTRNGKGSITSNNIGGDVDVKSLLDVEYFNNKRFGGLKIPKPFLGFEESLGANAGGTLTRLDTRYGRTIKRLQLGVVNGITDLLNLYLIDKGQSQDVGKFKVRVVSPTTVEDAERDESLMNKLNVSSLLLSTLGQVPGLDMLDAADLLSKKVLAMPEIADIVKKAKKNAEDNPNANDDMGF